MTSLRNSIAALAVSLPLVATAQQPAAAEPPKAPLAQIYGTLNLNLQYTEAGDATAGSNADIPASTALSIDSTNIGVRGTADVGRGLNVVYQCETQASIDGLDLRALCNRNSRLGLSGMFGTFFVGNWDTPMKAGAYGTKADDPFGNTDVFGVQGIMSSPGFNTRSGAYNGGQQRGFDLRAASAVAYWTPKFSGLSAKILYGLPEGVSRTGGTIVDPLLLSAVVNYDMAGLSVYASGEYHEDLYGIRTISAANSSNVTSKDMAWRVGAGYELPLGVGTLGVMGAFEQLLYKQDDAAAGLEDYDRMAWTLGAKFRTGDHEFRARFAQAMEPNCTIVGGTDCGDATSELGAQQYALGYAFHLAKSTQVYAFFTQIMNDDDAQYTFTVGGPQTGGGATDYLFAATPAGADPMAAGVGMRYAF
jgi:predicted porin